jgi:phosphohistidine phosphatase SixA
MITLKNIILYTLLSLAPGLVQADDIWSKLGNGGYVIIMRHAPTTKQGNPLRLDKSCKTERRLSDDGRKIAKAVGRFIRKHKVPVGLVLSSEFCRTRETAMLAFGRFKTWKPLNLIHTVADNKTGTVLKAINDRIASYKGRKNLVLVTHRPNIDQVTLESLQPGALLVLKPAGDGDFDTVGMYRPRP